MDSSDDIPDIQLLNDEERDSSSDDEEDDNNTDLDEEEEVNDKLCFVLQIRHHHHIFEESVQPQLRNLAVLLLRKRESKADMRAIFKTFLVGNREES